MSLYHWAREDERFLHHLYLSAHQRTVVVLPMVKIKKAGPHGEHLGPVLVPTFR